MTQRKKHGSFRAFYAAELLPLLTRMERKRKMRLVPYVVTALLILLLVPTMYRTRNWSVPLWYILATLPFGVAWMIDAVLFSPHKMRIQLQREVVARLIDHALPGLKHFEYEWVKSADFIASGIYYPYFTKYAGCNLFVASSQGGSLAFSWLKVEYRPRKNSGKNNKVPPVVFMGWFFVAYFRNRFVGETLLQPDFAESQLGWLGRQVQEFMTPEGAELVLIENAAVEKHFKVLSTSQDDARHVLTPTVMEEAARIASHLKSGMSISFSGNRMFAAVPVKSDFFDAMLTHSLTDPKPLRELFHAVRGMSNLTDLVARGTKVWD